MNQAFNARILVVDDDETIRDSFREILVPRKPEAAGLARASSALFDEGTPEIPPSNAVFEFELDEAPGGPEGLARVREAIENDRPYAAVFVDMRMPGWDGLRTVQEIRGWDNRAEIIFVTAYSDHAIEEIVERAGINVSYHCKPFSVEEIRQIATKAVWDWNKTRNLEELIKVISHLRAQRWQLTPLLHNILLQVAGMLGSLSAMLAERDEAGVHRKYIGIGKLAEDVQARPYLVALPGLEEKAVHYTERFAFFQVEKYSILAVLEGGMRSLNKERLHLVRLFLEQAALAIANVNLQETLLRNEKLSAVGQAISMVSHDLRGPIGSICQGIQLADEVSSQDPPMVRELHRMILNEAKNALTIVDDILDFARNSRLTKEWVEIEPFMEEIEKGARPYTQARDLALHTRVDGTFRFPADESKMKRVLLNLIRNAAEAVDQDPPASPAIRLSAEMADGGFTFRLSDNGPGIPREIENQLFVPFTTWGKARGTGLGLAIAKQFVEAHGGRIDVETSREGTTFTLFLPDNGID